MDQLIVFNALQTSLSGGIGRYSYELAKELYQAHPQNVKVVIRDEDRNIFDFIEEKDLIIAKGINNSKERNIYEQFKLPKLVANLYPDAILHYPDTMAPILAKNKVVITVHDLAFKSLNNVFTWRTVLWKNFVTNLSIMKADKIIAITNFTKSEIIKHYPNIKEHKISVVYNGFNDFSKEEIIDINVSNKIKQINSQYILTVSTISPRKNIDGLIRAFNKIKDKTDDVLVIAGNNGWMFEKVYDLVEELQIQDRVLFTGKVNEDELKYLYKNANKFAYVSFYEGFGLPPLEAISYGLPIVLSNSTSLPEVVGDIGMKVDPNDISGIAQALLDSNSSCVDRSLYKKQMEKYSWAKCALNVSKIYMDL